MTCCTVRTSLAEKSEDYMSEEPSSVSVEAETGVVVARANSFWQVDTLKEFTAAIMVSI